MSINNNRASPALHSSLISFTSFFFSLLFSFLFSLFSFPSLPSLPYLAFLFIIQFIKLAQNVLPRQSSLLRLAFLLIFSPQTLRPFSLPFFLFPLLLLHPTTPFFPLFLHFLTNQLSHSSTPRPLFPPFAPHSLPRSIPSTNSPSNPTTTTTTTTTATNHSRLHTSTS